MTIKHMRIFLAVYQTLSITKAAKQLHMTQPAVTRAIKEIEHYYGICLFERINHRLFLTKNAQNLYAKAIHIVESFDSLEKEIKNGDEFGLLRIGSSITLGNFLLPQAISSFKNSHPNFDIKATISNSTMIQNSILENKIDLALIEGNIVSPYLTCELLTTDRLCVVFAPNHPLGLCSHVKLSDLTAYPLLLREPGSAGRIFLDHTFEVHNLPIEPIWESASTQALIKGVELGIGISILPYQLVQSKLDSGSLNTCIIEDEPFTRSNYLVWHKQKYITDASKEFMQLCHNLADDLSI